MEGPGWLLHRAQPEPWGAAPTEPFSGHNSPDTLVSPLLRAVSSSPRTNPAPEPAAICLPEKCPPRAWNACGAAEKTPDPPQPPPRHGRLPGKAVRGEAGREHRDLGAGTGPQRAGQAAQGEKSKIRVRTENRGAVQQAQSPGSDTEREPSCGTNSQSKGADGSSGATEMKGRREKGNILGVGKHSAAQTILLVNWQPATRLITKLLYGQEKKNKTWQQNNLYSFLNALLAEQTLLVKWLLCCH